MRQIFTYGLATGICLILASCGNDNHEVRPNESTILLLNEDGGISTYAYPSDTENNLFFDFDRSYSWDKWYMDAVVRDGYAYLVTKLGGDIVKVSLADSSVMVSNKDAIRGYDTSDKSMELFQEQLIVGYFGGDPPRASSFVKFFNSATLDETDSIFLKRDLRVFDMKIIGTKLFLSVGRVSSPIVNYLLKLDINTKEIEEEIALDFPYSQLMVKSSDELWAFGNAGKIKIDPVNCNVIAKEAIYGESTYKTSAPSFAFDEKSNKLFYFTPAPQPAIAPLYLASFDVETGKETVIATYDDAKMADELIAFDTQREEIVVGSNNHLYFFTTEGELLREVDLKFDIHRLVLY